MTGREDDTNASPLRSRGERQPLHWLSLLLLLLGLAVYKLNVVLTAGGEGDFFPVAMLLFL